MEKKSFILNCMFAFMGVLFLMIFLMIIGISLTIFGFNLKIPTGSYALVWMLLWILLNQINLWEN